MSLNKILEKKNSENTRCVSNQTVLEVIKKMTKNKVHALMVMNKDNQLAGIVTDHDIMTLLARSDGVLKDIQVSEIMSTNLIKCPSGTSLKKVLHLMSHYHVRHIIVEDKITTKGLLSIKDVLKKLHENETLELNVLHDIVLASRS